MRASYPIVAANANFLSIGAGAYFGSSFAMVVLPSAVCSRLYLHVIKGGKGGAYSYLAIVVGRRGLSPGLYLP